MVFVRFELRGHCFSFSFLQDRKVVTIRVVDVGRGHFGVSILLGRCGQLMELCALDGDDGVKIGPVVVRLGAELMFE